MKPHIYRAKVYVRGNRWQWSVRPYRGSIWEAAGDTIPEAWDCYLSLVGDL